MRWELERVLKMFAIYNLWTTDNQVCRYTDQSAKGVGCSLCALPVTGEATGSEWCAGAL